MFCSPRFGLLRQTLAASVATLFEADYRLPATWGIGGNGTCASAFATDEWLLQETSGTHANNVGSATLANDTGLQGQEAIGLFDGTDYVSRKAWESGSTTANPDSLQCSDNVAGDADGVDIAGRIVFRGKDVFDNGNSLLSKYSAAGWLLTYGSGTVSLLVYDGTNLKYLNVPVLADSIGDGAWHYIDFMHDVSTGVSYLKSDLFADASIDASNVTGTLSKPTIPLFVNTYGTASNAFGQSGVQYTYVGVSVGANAQNFYDEAVVLPGSTPAAATVLTTQSRASLLSGQVSANHVCHFSGGVSAADGCQLPIVWHEHLESGTGGFGLLSNSARTNLIPYSESMGPSAWVMNAAQSAFVDNDGSSPAGFYNASSVTTSATNAFIYSASNIAVAASKTYTYSIWVKRNQGTDVAGKIRAIDIFSLSQSDQTFMATSDWTLVSVTHTSDAAATTFQLRNFIDTSGDSVLYYGAQLNEGTARGAYIRTNTAAASFVKSNYEVTFAAGLFIDSTKGEAEVVWVTENPGAGNAYLFDAWTSGNIDRILCYNATDGTRPTGTGYDGSSVSQWTVRKAAVSDMTTQENTFTLQWDETGSLSVAPGAEASAIYNGSVDETDIGSYTTSNLIDKIAIGQSRADGDQPDAIISHLRIFASER